MKPPSSRSCSKVRYINITSPPYGREKRKLLPSVKGSNRHHFGVPPGLAPKDIILYSTSKVNTGCARASFFFCRTLPFLKSKMHLGTERATSHGKLIFEIKISRNTPPARGAVQEMVKRISLTLLASLRAFLACESRPLACSRKQLFY